MSVIQALASIGVHDGDLRDTIVKHVELLSKGWKSALREEDDIQGTCLNEEDEIWSNGLQPDMERQLELGCLEKEAKVR